MAGGEIVDQNGECLPRVSIEYCTGCKWMLRAAWLSQELLTTFQDDLHSVTMIPSRPPAPAGTFQIMLNGDIVLWDRKEEGHFPEAKEVKQRIRDKINPDRSLGHSDTEARKQQLEKKEEVFTIRNGEDDDSCEECVEEKRETIKAMQASFEVLKDEEAEDMRRQLGVL
jgi:selenoprotein W-related protein